MSSVDKALLVYCTAVSFFCVALMVCVFKLQNAVVELNKNQETLDNKIEKVDDFNIKMWADQIKINRDVLGIPYETY